MKKEEMEQRKASLVKALGDVASHDGGDFGEGLKKVMERVADQPITPQPTEECDVCEGRGTITMRYKDGHTDKGPCPFCNG